MDIPPSSTRTDRPVTGAEVSLRGVRHGYQTPTGHLPVLVDVDLDIPSGGYVSLMGPSGSGKSTLLSLLGGLDRPERGSIRVGGAPVSELSGDALAIYRLSVVGFVFQHFGLLSALTAVENVEVPLMLSGSGAKARRRRAEEALRVVGMKDRASHLPSALSGGERQRVAIARALAKEPALVLADEPTGNLDREAGEQVIELLEEMNREGGCTVFLVSHNPLLAGRAPVRLLLEDRRVRRVA